MSRGKFAPFVENDLRQEMSVKSIAVILAIMKVCAKEPEKTKKFLRGRTREPLVLLGLWAFLLKKFFTLIPL